MPDELEYIVNDAIVQCNKGAKLNYFKATYNTHVKIMHFRVATQEDKLPLVNIPEFGVCAITGGPCTPAPVEWRDTYKLRVKGKETLLYRCKLPCGVGGTIEFITSGQIPISPDDLAAMTDEHSEQGPSREEEVKEEVEEEDEGGSWWSRTLDVAEFVPLIGGGIGAVRCVANGDLTGALLNVGSIALDAAGVVSGGAGNAASAGLKGAVKAGKALSKGRKVGKATRMAKRVIPGVKVLTAAGAKALAKSLAKKVDDIALKTGKICVFACFPAGTIVNVEHGQIAIEQIKVGDRVWAFDEATGEIGLREVVQTVARECDHTIELHTEQEVIETTAEHPFYTSEGWKDAADLMQGDKIVTRNNEMVEIIETKFSYKPKQVYNFEVADWHTYFVGTLAWLVHNAAKCVTEIVKRLPKYKGQWLGDVGESLWKSTKSAVNKVTKGEGVPFKNGYPDFSKWSKGRMKFKDLDGTSKDFDKVYERVAKQKGLKNKTQGKKYLKDNGLTPHHHQDGKTIELIPTALHKNIPHSGGASKLRKGI